MMELDLNWSCLTCGGEIKISEDRKTAKCIFCGNEFPITSSLKDSSIVDYGFATEYLRTFKYSDAIRKFLDVVAEEKCFAEAWWGAFLSEYGIEFEIDRYGQNIPTCHRANSKRIYDNLYYKNAVEHADASTQKKYRDLGQKIEELRLKIMQQVDSDESYDVFICFKATEIDNNRMRTMDRELASKIYNELTTQGYKVFFSEETLNNIKEQDYEPYIYKALTTAKVMFVLCSSEAKINSPWVKNEWSRFLDMHNGQGLVPICGNRLEPFRPSELPSELQKFNAIVYDTDLIKNINKKLFAFFPEKIKEKEEAERKRQELKRQQELDELKKSLLQNMGGKHYTEKWTDKKIIPFSNRDWIVLEERTDRMLIIAKDIIELRAFNEKDIRTTWAECSLRKYLNNEFLTKYFTKDEINKIISNKNTTSNVTYTNSSNKKITTLGGADTFDKVFLLSNDEIKTYFDKAIDRIAIYKGKAKGWWTRSPGSEYVDMSSLFSFIMSPIKDIFMRKKNKMRTNCYSTINKAGVLNIAGGSSSVNDNKLGVRPAIWIKK